MILILLLRDCYFVIRINSYLDEGYSNEDVSIQEIHPRFPWLHHPQFH